MLKEIVKRDGTIEPFVPSKVNSWSIWASEQLGNRVDWSGVVMEAMSFFKDRASSQDLQKQLIKICVQKKSWPYSLMAGRLYAALTRKEIYGDIAPPTIQQVHKNLSDVGLMIKLDYSDEEYAQIEKFIDHSRDFELAYPQILQLRKKYALRNRVSKQEYESPQFVYMRMAMRLAMNSPKAERLKHIVEQYNHFSFNRVNAPSPNYVNLGTKLNGFVSCALYKSGDTVNSLAIGDHIAYQMTGMSAGIGNTISTRTLGDPVRSGAIMHQGKLPYYRSMAYATLANQQAGRGGACTTYYSAYDPENVTIAQLQNPLSTEDKKIREIHFGVLFNNFFSKKVAKNEDVFLFTQYSAPDLWQAMYSGDQAEFERIYNEYDQNEYIEKKYIKARDFVILARQQAYECGTHYECWIDEMNRHTPFKDPIYSSNLCVEGSTKILTNHNEVEIRTLKDQPARVWNGEEFSDVMVRQTGTGVELMRVVAEDLYETVTNKYEGDETEYKTPLLLQLDCTPEHHWHIQTDAGPIEIETKQLKLGMTTIEWAEPYTGNKRAARIISITKLSGVYDTYCFTEEKRHMGIFNGLLTGQCNEIAEPTKEYETMMDLYTTDHHRGEIATCSLAGLVVCNIHSDTQYESAAYYALKMVDDCIDMSEYPFPHVAYTARARRSAGVGMLGVATELARRGLKYDTVEGRRFIHFLAERHYYYLLKASLRLAKERGNAPWIHKTKWPEGWLPIDTYKKTVDEIVAPLYYYDWEGLRSEIIAQGGIRNSVLCAHMPTESSSKSAGVPNSLYPIRELALKKSDNTNVIDWVATDSDLLADKYQLAWDIDTKDMIKVYAIFQKFADQGISADFWRNRVEDPAIYTDEIVEEHLMMCKYGMKGRYYQNSLTSDQVKHTKQPMALIVNPEFISSLTKASEEIREESEEASGADDIFEYDESGGRGCSSGACTL